MASGFARILRRGNDMFRLTAISQDRNDFNLMKYNVYKIKYFIVDRTDMGYGYALYVIDDTYSIKDQTM